VSEIREVVIIGSGPAGHTAAIYTARANLRPVLIGGELASGGALMNTTEVENYPGFGDPILGPALMGQMQTQAERFGAQLVAEDAEFVDLDGPVKTIRVRSGAEYRARTVILAMGSAYRELGVPNESRLSGHGVSWCATCDGFFFKGQDIAVVGGGDSAMEEATFLTRFANKVRVVHRRGHLRASQVMQDRAFADPKLEFTWNAEVIDIRGEARVTGLHLRDTRTGEPSTLAVTGVFVAIGHTPRSELVAGQVTVTPEGYLAVKHPSTRTNLAGVFACGDLVDPTYMQAITAAGSGCQAALDTERYLAALPVSPTGFAA
jgi:thioredoxin reductase (NADPH)